MRIIFPSKSTSYSYLAKMLKFLPLVLFISSLLIPVANFICTRFDLPFLPYYLGLSLQGIRTKYYWQLLSYPFIASLDTVISQAFLVKITLTYVLQKILIRMFVDKIGSLKFLFFWCGQSLLIGILSLVLMQAKGIESISYGSLPLLMSMTTIGIFLDPEKKIGLPILPIYFSTKWVALVVIGFIFSVLISQNQLMLVLNSIISIITSVIFCRFEGIRNPYISDLSF